MQEGREVEGKSVTRLNSNEYLLLSLSSEWRVCFINTRPLVMEPTGETEKLNSLQRSAEGEMREAGFNWQQLQPETVKAQKVMGDLRTYAPRSERV